MTEFYRWFTENIFANIFTLITVILSGFISWLISAIYFYIGNRNNLKVSVICNIIQLLSKDYSKEGYDLLYSLSKDYAVRYMNKNERRKLTQLLSAYKDVSLYNDIDVNAEIMFAYFKYELNKNGVKLKFIPIYCENEYVYDDYHPDLCYMIDDLKRVLKKYNIYFQEQELESAERCQYDIESIFKVYAKNCYNIENIDFFKDYSFDDVLDKTKIRTNWNNKFEILNAAKEQFLNLKIVKQTTNK